MVINVGFVQYSPHMSTAWLPVTATGVAGKRLSNKLAPSVVTDRSQPPSSMAPPDWSSGLSVKVHLPTQALLTWHQDADPCCCNSSPAHLKSTRLRNDRPVRSASCMDVKSSHHVINGQLCSAKLNNHMSIKCLITSTQATEKYYLRA